MFRSLFFIIILITAGSLSAQDTMSLEEVLSKTLANNLSLQEQTLNTKIAQIDAAKSNAVFLPRVNASYTATRTNDPLNVFGTKLKQQIVTQKDFAPTLLNNPIDITNFNAAIKIEQPLFNLDGIYIRNATKAKALAIQYQLKRSKEYIEFQVKRMYTQLQLLYAANITLEKAKKTVAANVDLVNNMSKQGYTKPSDVLEVKARLTDVENKILDNKINIQNLSDQLYYMMGEVSQNTLQPTTLPKEIPKTTKLLSQGSLLENRADFLAYQERIKARKQMVHANRSKFVPRLNAFGQYEINDSRFFKNNADNYMIGVQLSWSLFNGNQNRKNIQKSKAELEGAEIAYQNYKTQSQTELNKAHRAIENALAKITLTEKALQQAKESYRIRKNRFEEGLEKTTDLLKDETQVETKNLNYLQALFQLKTAVYYLDFLTVTNK